MTKLLPTYGLALRTQTSQATLAPDNAARECLNSYQQNPEEHLALKVKVNNRRGLWQIISSTNHGFIPKASTQTHCLVTYYGAQVGVTGTWRKVRAS